MDFEAGFATKRKSLHHERAGVSWPSRNAVTARTVCALPPWRCQRGCLALEPA